MEDIISDTYFVDETGEIMVVKLKGYIDQSNSFGLQKAFNDIAYSGCYKLIIDFSEVLYISSAGWGIFVGEIKRFRDENGDIKLSNMSPDIYEVYQMLEFYHIFNDFNSIEQAVNSFKDTPSKSEKMVEDSISENNTIELEENQSSDLSEDITEKNTLEITISETETSENIKLEHEENVDSESSREELESAENLQEAENEIDENQMMENSFSNDQKNENTSIIDLSKLPLHEKIKKIIAEYPLLNFWQIKKLLKDERFGTVNLNFIKLYKILRDYDLNTKYKRYRFYRSC